MATRETTVAEILRDAGYTTAVFGKWHLGDNYPSRPGDQGFDESMVHLAGGIGQVGDYVNYHALDSSYFDPVLFHNGKPVQTKGYCSDVYTEAAVEFIRNHADNPFFLYLAYNAPHTPLQVPQESYSLYAGLDSVPGQTRVMASGVPESRLPSSEVIRRLYGMVTNIDDNIGRLLDQLEASGLRDNTLVIFLTDNGPQQFRYNAGLRGLKGTVYEGGIRVPCFFHWPGVLESDREVDTYAAHIDLLPTMLGLAGLEAPDTIELDGQDLSEALKTGIPPNDERTLFYEWQRGYPEPYRNVAVRRGPYKLVGHAAHHASVEELELYNLEEDPGEQINLSARRPDRVEALKVAFDEWIAGALESPSIGNTRIAVGTPHENPVVLNRNDARGSPGMWRQDRIYGYWEVDVKKAGNYDFDVHFFEPVGQPGALVVRVGPVQRTAFNSDTSTTSIRIEEVPLRKGEFMVESWYSGENQVGPGPAFTHFPFYIEILKK
jgi:arylsulfatase A-like enzyme